MAPEPDVAETEVLEELEVVDVPPVVEVEPPVEVLCEVEPEPELIPEPLPSACADCEHRKMNPPKECMSAFFMNKDIRTNIRSPS